MASIPGRSPSNPRTEVWVTGVEFNNEEKARSFFYIACRAGDNEIFHDYKQMIIL